MTVHIAKPHLKSYFKHKFYYRVFLTDPQTQRNLRQFSSSDPSLQSVSPSQYQCSAIQLPSVQRNSLSEHLRISGEKKKKTNSSVLLKDIKNEHICHWCWCVYTPTALLITVVPAVVVAVAVPQAANAVAILAVKLVFLALPGSCRGTNGGEKFQTTNK